MKMWPILHYSRTPKQTPHFDTRSEIYPSRTLVKNEIMKTSKTAQKHRKSCEKMHMALFLVRDGLSQHSSPIFHSPKGLWKILQTCAEINPSRTQNNAICISCHLTLYLYIFRFSAENSISDCETGSSSTAESLSRQSTPTKPILVKRGDSYSPPSSAGSGDSAQVPPRTKPLIQGYPRRKEQAGIKNNVIKARSQQVQRDAEHQCRLVVEGSAGLGGSYKAGTVVEELEEVEQVHASKPVVSGPSRCRSAPASRQYHWDSSSRQWFANKSLSHRDSDNPIEVRVFKYNVNQPKINRWTTSTTTTQPGQKIKQAPQTYSFKCSNTVELVNSLRKSAPELAKNSYSTNHYQGDPAVYVNTRDPPYYTSPKTTTPLIEVEEYPVSSSSSMQSSGVVHLGQRVSRDDTVPAGMSLGSVYPPDQMSKSQARAELQGISTRLGSYIQYVREISENANQVDLASFVNSIKILEEELVNIKTLYEGELGSARWDFNYKSLEFQAWESSMDNIYPSYESSISEKLIKDINYFIIKLSKSANLQNNVELQYIYIYIIIISCYEF